jgi:hypothetical protein
MWYDAPTPRFYPCGKIAPEFRQAVAQIQAGWTPLERHARAAGLDLSGELAARLARRRFVRPVARIGTFNGRTRR